MILLQLTHHGEAPDHASTMGNLCGQGELDDDKAMELAEWVYLHAAEVSRGVHPSMPSFRQLRGRTLRPMILDTIILEYLAPNQLPESRPAGASGMSVGVVAPAEHDEVARLVATALAPGRNVAHVQAAADRALQVLAPQPDGLLQPSQWAGSDLLNRYPSAGLPPPRVTGRGQIFRSEGV